MTGIVSAVRCASPGAAHRANDTASQIPQRGAGGAAQLDFIRHGS
jgi:hypothetical protein